MKRLCKWCGRVLEKGADPPIYGLCCLCIDEIVKVLSKESRARTIVGLGGEGPLPEC